MRILLIQTQAENAGAQEVARLIGEGLKAGSHTVRHLFLYRKTAGFDQHPDADYASLSRPSGPISFARLMYRVISQIRGFRPDIVLCFQHYGNIVGAITTRLATSAPVVAHQLSAPAVVPRSARWLDRVLGSAGAYDSIVVNSEVTEGQYAQHETSYRRRLIRIDHGFAPKTSRLPREVARKALGIEGDGQLIGCAARLHASKRLDLAVRLLTIIPDVRLVLAGQGPEEETLRQLASTLGVAQRLQFLGELSHEQIPVFLAALDVFVFPSEAESFGLAAVEAAQSGVPCVVNALPVLKEVLSVDEEPCALFVDCNDILAFSARVKDALAGHPDAKAAAERAAHLADRYSASAMVKSYEHLLDLLVRTGP